MLNVRMPLVLVMILLSVFACSSQVVRTQLYTLHATASAVEGSVSSSVVSGAVGVGPIILPESLRRSEVVLFGDSNQILVNPRYLWAGDLKQAISRVMASNLSSQLGKDDVWSFPWDVRTRPDTQVSIVIEQLGGQLGQSAVLKAKWKIVSNQGETILRVGRCEFERSSDAASYDAYVASINILIDECSSVVATQLVDISL